MSALVSFGELMLRLTTPGHLRFSQAAEFEITFGGAEANVAVAVAQLGGSAEFVSRLPEHELAQRALDELKGLGVGVRHVTRGGDRLGVYFLEQGASQRPGRVLYDRAHSAIAEASPAHFHWDTIFAGAQWFHWSGITPALSDSAAAIVAQACASAKRAGLSISFDMNFRAKLWTPQRAGEVLAPLMHGVDLCVCGAEEALSVFGMRGDSEGELAAAMREQFGFKIIAMTQRQSASATHTDWGAVLFSSTGEAFTSRRYHIEIVDRVGAGDSFTGALIFALMRGDPPQVALEFAVAASALKHTIPGDYARFSLHEVEALAKGGGGGRVQR